jgi:hypothetical protein
VSTGVYVRVPGTLEQSALVALLESVRGNEPDLLARARARAITASWCQEHMLAYRPEPLYAERFDDRTPRERPGEPDGRAIRFERDGEGLVAVVDIGDMCTLETDRGLRFEAWYTAGEGVILDQSGHAFGVQRRWIKDGKVRAFARLTAVPHSPLRYEVESYDFDADGHLSGIRSDGPAAWSAFYMQVVRSRGGRPSLRFAGRWAVEPVELTNEAVDQLESGLTRAVGDRVCELLSNRGITDDVQYLVLYGDPVDYSLLYATAEHRRVALRHRKYRPFDFYLYEFLENVASRSEEAFRDLAADADLLTRELTKRRQQPRLDAFTAGVALSLNERGWPERVRTTRDILIFARRTGTRREELRDLKASIPPARWALLEETENAIAHEHAASRSVPSIARRAGRARLVQLVRDAGCDERRPDAETPRRLFEAFVRFLGIAINGIEPEQEDVLFEVHSAGLDDGDIAVTLVRQLSLHNRDESYIGMETIKIDMTFTPTGGPPPANATIWSESADPRTWADRVRASS